MKGKFSSCTSRYIIAHLWLGLELGEDVKWTQLYFNVIFLFGTPAIFPVC